MAANPALVQAATGEMMPAPFPDEQFVLRRPGCGFEIDGVRTASGKWSATGTVYASNVRLVFLADKPDASGLAGFDLPLVYITADKLNQPIFGCNNLSGRVWPAVDGGGPAGALPPHDWKVKFKAGGIGTLWPLYYALAQRARRAAAANAAAGAAGPAAAPAPSSQPGQEAADVATMAQAAFVDPSDPSTVYITQPVGEAQRLKERPRYAANYGKDDAPYQPM